MPIRKAHPLLVERRFTLIHIDPYSLSLNNRSPPIGNRGYTPIGLKRDKRWCWAKVNLNARFKPIGPTGLKRAPTGLKRAPTGLKRVTQANPRSKPGFSRVFPGFNPGQPGSNPGQPGSNPGQPGSNQGQPGSNPGQSRSNPGPRKFIWVHPRSIPGPPMVILG